MIFFRDRGALFGECWFDNEAPPSDCNVDVLAFRQRSAPIANSHCTPQLTLVSELTTDPNALLEKFARTCRQSILRADRRDELWMELTTRPGAHIRDFCSFYDAFARQKRLRPANGVWFEAACDADCLAIATVWKGKEPLVRHAYVLGGEIIHLHTSASLFRTQDQDNRALIGRANRWLHWRSMLYFAERGATRHDWGGLFETESTPEQEGVNRFKKDFGGKPERRYDCLVACTARGRVRLGLKRLGDGWRYVGARVAGRRSPPSRLPASPAPGSPPDARASTGADA
jgi:hypothetical protein